MIRRIRWYDTVLYSTQQATKALFECSLKGQAWQQITTEHMPFSSHFLIAFLIIDG